LWKGSPRTLLIGVKFYARATMLRAPSEV